MIVDDGFEDVVVETRRPRVDAAVAHAVYQLFTRLSRLTHLHDGHVADLGDHAAVVAKAETGRIVLRGRRRPLDGMNFVIFRGHDELTSIEAEDAKRDGIVLDVIGRIGRRA